MSPLTLAIVNGGEVRRSDEGIGDRKKGFGMGERVFRHTMTLKSHAIA